MPKKLLSKQLYTARESGHGEISIEVTIPFRYIKLVKVRTIDTEKLLKSSNIPAKYLLNTLVA